MDCSLPGSSVHGIFHARTLEWVAISFSRRPSWPGDGTRVSRIADRHFTVWADEGLNISISQNWFSLSRSTEGVTPFLFSLTSCLSFFPLLPSRPLWVWVCCSGVSGGWWGCPGCPAMLHPFWVSQISNGVCCLLSRGLAWKLWLFPFSFFWILCYPSWCLSVTAQRMCGQNFQRITYRLLQEWDLHLTSGGLGLVCLDCVRRLFLYPSRFYDWGLWIKWNKGRLAGEKEHTQLIDLILLCSIRGFMGKSKNHK